MIAFQPTNDPSVNINVSAVSQRIHVCTTSTPIQVRVVNDGTATVWMRFGDQNVVADVNTSEAIEPGDTEVFSAPAGLTDVYVAVIAAGTTGKIYFQAGEGL